MAVNTHKHGYSTSEVAQVFGCSVSHIHQLIEDKKLGASITESNRPNGRRTIRIEREHIQRYMKDNPKRFSVNDNSNPTELSKNAPMRETFSEIKAHNAEAAKAVSQTVSPAKEGPVVYSLLVNGKVSVSGITKETAVTIVQALLNDTGTGEFTAIAILKNIPKGGAR